MKRKRLFMGLGILSVIVLLMFLAATNPFGNGAPNSEGDAFAVPASVKGSDSTQTLERSAAPLPASPALGAPAVPGPMVGAAPQTKSQAGGQSAPTNPIQNSGWSQLQQDEKIIRTGMLSLTVADVDKSTDAVSTIVAGIPGSFISGTNLRQENDRVLATITIKVPSDSFDQMVRQLRGIADKVNNVQVTSNDVTEEYVDLQSQLRNLKATEERYLQLLARAQKIEEIVLLQDRISNVEAQIERIQGRVNFLERRTDFSTITVQLLPPGINTQVKNPLWNPAKTLEQALKNLFVTFRGTFDGLIYMTVYALPLIPVIVVLYLILRRRSTLATVPARTDEKPC